MNDCIITFSAETARKIGVDQAIMLSVLKQLFQFRPSTQQGWLELTDQDFLQHLPFWDTAQIQRSLDQLRAQSLLEINQQGTAIHPKLFFRLVRASRSTSKGLPIVNMQNTASQTPQSNHSNSPQGQTPPQNKGASFIDREQPIHEQWLPDKFVVQQCRQLGIPDQFLQQAVPEFVTYWREQGTRSRSWGSKFQKHVLKLWRKEEASQASHSKPASITRDWKPSQDTIEILARDGVEKEFIEHSVPEFILYWMERGNAETTWNSKFIYHIRNQWKKFCSSIEHSTNPMRIARNWQPSPDCYEIFKMAKINTEFAKSQIKPFVLYWSDTNQTATSWNTKFVQHVKWTWAKQHQLEKVGYEKATGSHSSGNPATQSFVQRHTDTSWSDGLQS